MIYMSPGLYVRERDLTGGFPAVATSSAALVGYSAKGDVDGVRLITNSRQFIDHYGKPDPSTGHYFHYAALAYLARGNALYCLRVMNGALYGGVNIMRNDPVLENAVISVGQSEAVFGPGSGMGDDVLFQILGANPGVWNNKTGVVIRNVKTGGDEIPSDQYTFEIVVYYKNDDGVSEEVEKWKVSRKSKKDGFGRDLYLESKINGISNYIVVLDNTDLADTILPKAQATRLDFEKGLDGGEVGSEELVDGWELFANPADVDVRILINGGETAQEVQQKMQAIAEARADCLAILDMSWSAVQTLGGMTTFRTNTSINSSYCALYTPWLLVYDSYNDKKVYIPPSGHVAAQYAYNDYIDEPWFAPAGFKRGLLNVLATNYVFDETGGELDTLYTVQINPIQLFRNEGIVIWGQKTLQRKTSDSSSVNVRRLFIVIEKTVVAFLHYFVEEPNDEITRFRVKSRLEEYLDSLSAKRAFQTEANDKGYYVLCDENNNTAQTIQDKQMNVDLFVKPIHAAEFIQLQVISTPISAKIEELVSSGAMF